MHWSLLQQQNYTDKFYLGEWLVMPKQNQLRKAESEVYIEPKLMEVLLYLCSVSPEVVSADELIINCWPNQYFSDNPIHKSIARIRKALNDDARNPKYIKTTPKKGYSIIHSVTNIDSQHSKPEVHWQDGPPYLGFKSYQAKHQSIFYGRHKAREEIKQLIKQSSTSNSSLLMIMGAHSVGKTSLVDSQIIPLIQSGVFTLNNPVGCCIKYTISKDILIDEAMRFMNQLIQQTDYDSLEVLLESSSHGLVNVVFIDQLERIFVNRPVEQVEAFLQLFSKLFHAENIFIITAFNHEYFADLMQLDGFHSLKKQAMVYDLLPPDREEMRDIIKKPVAASGLLFEYDKHSFKSLDQVLMDEVQNRRHVLPILSHVMRELCLNKNKHNELTFSAYHHMGSLKQFIAKKFEKIFKSYGAEEQDAFKQRLHLLIKFDHKSSEKLYCAEVEIDQFRHESFNDLLEELMSANLIGTEVIDGRTYVTIVDDSLLSQCDIFISWIASNRTRITSVAEFQVLHSSWQKNNRSKNFLISNEYLLTSAKSLNLIQSESEFLNQSIQKVYKVKRIKNLSNIALVTMLIVTFSLLIKLQSSNNSLNEAYNQSESFNSFLMKDLKNKLKPIGNQELLTMISQQTVAYYDSRKGTPLTVSSMNHLMDALSTLGEVEINSGRLDQGMIHLLRADQYAALSLQLDSKHMNTLFLSSQINYWMGYVHYLNKDWDQAEIYWSKYLNIAKKLSSIEPDDPAWQLEHSYALNNLGTVSLSLSNNEKAEAYLLQSVDIKSNLVNQFPNNSQYLADLADTISWQASLKNKNNQIDQAKALYQQSLLLSERLHKIDPLNFHWNYRLAVAHHRVGLSWYDFGKMELAKEQFSESLRLISKNTSSDESNHKWIKTLINSHIGLAKVNRHLKMNDDALWHVEQGLFYYYRYSKSYQKLSPQLKQLLLLTTESSLIINDLGQHKTALMQYQRVFEEVKNHNKDIQFSSFEKAKHYIILSKLQQSVDVKASISLLGLARSELLGELEKGNGNKLVKALFIQINEQDQNKQLMAELKEEIKSMNYKNPDYFK